MSSFTDTKKSIESAFAEINALEPRHFRLESLGTAGGESVLVVRGSDDFETHHAVELRFYGVEYISAFTNMYWCQFSLAKPIDARPIEQLCSSAPVWVVCIEMSAEGGPPFKYFIAAQRVEIDIDRVEY